MFCTLVLFWAMTQIAIEQMQTNCVTFLVLSMYKEMLELSLKARFRILMWTRSFDATTNLNTARWCNCITWLLSAYALLVLWVRKGHVLTDCTLVYWPFYVIHNYVIYNFIIIIIITPWVFPLFSVVLSIYDFDYILSLCYLEL